MVYQERWLSLRSRYPKMAFFVSRERNQAAMRLEHEPEIGDHIFRATARPSEDAAPRRGLIVGDAVSQPS